MLRECVVCGSLFERPRKTDGELSRRWTCGDACSVKMRAGSAAEAHRRAEETREVEQRECVSCGTWFEPPRHGGQRRARSRRKTCGVKCAAEITSWAMIQAHREAQKNPEVYRRWMKRDFSNMGKKRQQRATETKEEARKKTKAEQARARYQLDPEKRRARSREYERKKRLEKKNAIRLGPGQGQDGDCTPKHNGIAG